MSCEKMNSLVDDDVDIFSRTIDFLSCCYGWQNSSQNASGKSRIRCLLKSYNREREKKKRDRERESERERKRERESEREKKIEC